MRVNLVLQTSFGMFGILRDLVDPFLASLFDRGDFAIKLNVHNAECGFKSVRVLRFHQVNESNNAVVTIKILAGTLETASFADELSFLALVDNVCQMSRNSFVEFPVTTVINARNLLNKTLPPMLKSLVERILFLAVVVVAGDRYPVHFFLLKFTYFFRFKGLATVANGALGSLRKVLFSTNTAKTVAT